MAWRVSLLVMILLLRLFFNYLMTGNWIDVQGDYTVAGQANLPTSDGWVKQKVVFVVEKRLPEPEAGLVLGVVLGYKTSLGRQFYQALIDSGTVHMVVASGYNVILVASLALTGFLIFWRRRWATLAAVGVMGFYAWLTGGEVSVLRASLMASLLLFSQVIGRANRSGWSLLLVVWLMLMVSPVWVVDISFQLSVAATFGVVVVAPKVKEWLDEKAILAGMVDRLGLVTTLSAILVTTPIIFYHFGRASFLAIFSNTLILPLVPPLMALGGAMMALGLIMPGLTWLLAWPSYAVAHVIVILVQFFGKA